MGYWEKVGDLDKLVGFAKEWKTLKELKQHFDLTSMESWRLFTRIIKHYDEFEYRDDNGTRAGQPKMFRATESAYHTLKIKLSI